MTALTPMARHLVVPVAAELGEVSELFGDVPPAANSEKRLKR